LNSYHMHGWTYQDEFLQLLSFQSLHFAHINPISTTYKLCLSFLSKFCNINHVLPYTNTRASNTLKFQIWTIYFSWNCLLKLVILKFTNQFLSLLRVQMWSTLMFGFSLDVLQISMLIPSSFCSFFANLTYLLH
jgi:hypothetical protein